MTDEQTHLRSNPYIVGAPIKGEEMFFGRDDIFEAVKARLIGQYQDNVIVIFGQRRTGKTSVLYQMGRHLNAQDERYITVLIDLQGLTLSGMGEFLWGLAGTIQRALRRDYALDLPHPDRVTFQQDAKGTFRDAFLPQLSKAVDRRRLLLMFDEADRFEEAVRSGYLDPSVFGYLRNLMQHEQKLSFIFSLGSKLEQMGPEYALMFNTALYLQVSFLSEDAARALVTRPVVDLYTFEEDAIKRLLALTSCHPYYTQLLCHTLFTRWEREGWARVTATEVDAVLDEAVNLAMDNLQYIWKEANETEKLILAALAEIGSPNTSRSALTSHLEQMDIHLNPSDVTRALNRLDKHQVIVSLVRPCLTVELVRRWLAQEKPLAWAHAEMGQIHSIASRHIRLGQTYRDQGRNDLARQSYQQALEAVPDNVEALLGLGIVCLAEEEWQNAVESFSRAMKIAPDQPKAREGLIQARLSLAHYLLDDDRVDDAEAEYGAVLALHSESVGAEAGLAAVAARRKIARLREQASAAAFREDWMSLENDATVLLTLVPDDGQAQAWLSQAQRHLRVVDLYKEGEQCIAQGRWDEARDLFNQVTAIEPAYRDVAQRAAEAVRQLGDRKVKKRAPLHWGLLLLGGVGLVILVTWGLWAASRPRVGSTMVRERDGAVMVYVPAGSFLMGSELSDVESALELCGKQLDDCSRDWIIDEWPQHTVSLGSFWIDKTEVTNRQYEACVQAGKCEPSTLADDPIYNGSEYPVVGVDWTNARLYCQWVGGDLPTEAQWEKAARGTDGRTYPWGDDFDESKANFCDVNCSHAYAAKSFDDGQARTAPVGSFPAGTSPYGALDMSGNVWEWVMDWHDSAYYHEVQSDEPSGPATGTLRVARGGSYGSAQFNLRSADRHSLSPASESDDRGFRCVYLPASQDTN
jgi:formylglycine-generating enzyme required for sulfatase activity